MTHGAVDQDERDPDALLLAALRMLAERFGTGWFNAWAVHAAASELLSRRPEEPPARPALSPAGPWRASLRSEYDLNAALAFRRLERLALVERKPIPGPNAGIRLAGAALAALRDPAAGQMPLSADAAHLLRRSSELLARHAEHSGRH